MLTHDLTYEKWGTRIAACDEGDDGLRQFVFDGTKASAEANGWELLHGPAERILVDTDYDGDPVYAYLWPVARTDQGNTDFRPKTSEPCCDQAGVGDHDSTEHQGGVDRA